MIEEIKQYRDDIFDKLGLSFIKGKRLLDIGCGDGGDAEIFIKEFGLTVCGVDVYQHKNISKVKGLNYKKAGIYSLPFSNNFFDYVFLHDVLHHIDEPKQRYKKHILGLEEIKRVCKKNGIIIIVEANRYNPLLYPHIVLMEGHDHFKQGYFKKLINGAFNKNNVEFKYFEAHLYPRKLLKLFKVYEKIMERFSFLKPFLAYNVAIIKNDK